MTNILKFIVLISFLCIGTTMNAQVKYVNEFLNIGVGARAHGMSGSVVATVNDASSGYWNPAGLSKITSPLQVSAMHTGWFGGIANYDYGTVAKRFSDRKSAGSITIIRMGIDNIPNTINLIAPDGSVNYDNVTTFSAVDYAALVSYGKRLTPNWAVGGSVKVIHRSIGSFGKAWGFGADLGVQYTKNGFKFGAMVRDITTTYNTWTFNLTEDEKDVFLTTGNKIPVSSTESTLPRLILGFSYKNNVKNFSYLVEGNFNVNTDGRKSAVLANENIAVDPSLGLELGYNDKVFVRAGLGNIQRSINATNYQQRDFEFQPNVGVGLNLGRLKIDYALANIGNLSGINASHIFSLTLDIKPKARKL